MLPFIHYSGAKYRHDIRRLKPAYDRRVTALALASY